MHRGAAGVFVALALYHIYYLLFTERGKQQFKAILPRLKDGRDVVLVLLRYLFRFPASPIELEQYTYVEKAEYWALIWGSIIMTLTGAMLLLVNLVMANLPLWVINLAGTVHFLEAVLAVSAILVWHFYWTIFDPQVYPMNFTWILGRPQLKPEMSEGKGLGWETPAPQVPCKETELPEPTAAHEKDPAPAANNQESVSRES
jgi:hypothetical protein